MTDAEQTELHKLIAFCCTCKRRNTPEWMAMLADRINAAIAAIGSDDRVEWPRGGWAHEFHMVSGGARGGEEKRQ